MSSKIIDNCDIVKKYLLNQVMIKNNMF